MLTIAITFIFSALVLYTLGVWAERISGKLKPWHAIVFWCGLVCDSVGTGAMGRIAGGMFQFNFHGVTGMLAILLMLFHATWATIVLVRKNERLIANFHKLSVFVWCVWLVPMLSGMIFGMTR
jgi:TIGR03987 family protein